MTESEHRICLVGGLAMRASELEPIKLALQEGNARVFVQDNIDVGEGPRTPIGESLTIEAQALHHWHSIDSLYETSSRWTLFGISMGGMIAATMASMHPERVIRVFLTATSANSPQLPAIPDQLYSAWLNSKTPDDLDRAVTIAFGATCLQNRAELKNAYFKYRLLSRNGQTPREFVAQLNAIRAFNGPEVYGRLSMLSDRVTVIAGEEDTLFSDPHLQDIKQRLPQANTVILPRTGHMIHIEDPHQIVSELLKDGAHHGPRTHSQSG